MLSDHDITRVAEVFGSHVLKMSATGFSQMPCPLAPWKHSNGIDKNPSFGVNRSGFSHCFACGFAGDLDQLADEIVRVSGGEHSYDLNVVEGLSTYVKESGAFDFSGVGDYDSKSETYKDYIFPDWWIDSFEHAHKNDEAMTYLASREGGPISELAAEVMDLRYDSYRRRVCFPLRDKKWNLIGLHGRAIDDDAKLKYMVYKHQDQCSTQSAWGENWLDFEEKIVIAESVFDGARVFQVYPNVWSPLTASVTKIRLDRLSEGYRFLTLFDNDEAGDEARKKTGKMLGRENVRHLYPKDDAGSMSVYQVADLLEGHVRLRDNFLV